ncbi:STAS domain-containing protein [Pleurocapsa sp. PCC 7319]|uniref:STAS domain-containing protein n=1 Tax=Pleurocapsa sp. PCC 7319 TaxID=118161 RepID=UPI0003455A9D|nr:STAS domain-containing protein [Pleurocapsa sp. PCC 7319]
MTTNFKIIQPEGILDSVNTNDLRREILDLINSGVKIVLVNLQDITFMNSSGMGALVATLKAVKAAGGELALCSLSDQVRIIFELSRMDRIFQVYGDRQEFEAKYTVSAN